MTITLTKGITQKLSLTKGGAEARIRVNLKWNQREEKKGMFGRRSTAEADLDLGCMYELKDGSKGVIQALGNNFGSLTSAPFIALDGDDRQGGSAEGENLTVGTDQLKRVVIFAYIYKEAGDKSNIDFSSVAGRVTMNVNGEQLDLSLDNPQKKTFCAVAQIVNNGGQLSFTKEELYFGGHEECDKNYGFGFNWRRATK